MPIGCSCSSCARRSSCCSAREDATGGLAGAAERFLAGACFEAFACCAFVCGALVCCTNGAATLAFETQRQSVIEHVTEKKKNGSPKSLAPPQPCDIDFARADREATAFRPRPLSLTELPPQRRRGIRILAEGRWVSLAQNFHHPVIEIIDGVIQDRLKTPVIFFVSLLNIISQTHANVFMFASQADVVGTEHLDILHGNFGHTICPPVQVLLFGKQRRNVKRGGGCRQLLDGVGQLSRGRSLPKCCGALPRQVRCPTLPGS